MTVQCLFLQGRTTTPGVRRPTSAMNSTPREQQSHVQSLQRLVKEKEDHISQLLQEREIERSDLARVTLDREMAESEILNQRAQIERLNQQLQSMEAAHQLLQEEYEQMTLRLHEEKKNLEDLQFRMEEENINKSTMEPRNADEDSKIFELEEALISAREANEHTEAELERVRAELAALQTAHLNMASSSTATEEPTVPTDSEASKNDNQSASTHDLEREVRDAKVGSPSKLSLHRVNLVAQASVAPVQMNPDSALQAECERLRRELADRERVTESALKRQAEVLEVVSSDFQKQIADLNAQVLSASKELIASREECQTVKEQSQVTIAELQEEIHQLKSKFADEESKAKETLSCYQKRIEDLMTQLDSEKGKTSATVMEQSVALRKLEEKLKVTERQLLDYQQSVLFSAQESVQNQIEQVSGLADDTCPILDKSALLEQLKRQQASYEEQMKTLESERNAAIETQRASGDRIQQLEAELSSLREELVSSGHKQEELSEQMKSAKEVRDKVLAELSSLLQELPAVGGVETGDGDLARELRTRIDLLGKHVSEAEANRDALELQVQTLQRERSELERELAVLNASQSSHDAQQDLNILLEQLESSRQKMVALEASTSIALKELESKSSELEKVQKSLSETLVERDQLQQAHQQTMAMLESERRQLQERIRAAESGAAVYVILSFRAEFFGSMSPRGPSQMKYGSSRQFTGSNDQVSRLMEEKAGAESQVAFLNSIIVDLHEKNRELEERVRDMLMVDNISRPQAHPPVANPRPPRRWCDNCLVFDSHETEHCPNKLEHNGNGFKPRKKLSALVGQQPSDRIYCDICGVFDSHTTENCTDTQTF
ncbi:unnamed protein product [Echinostoma caproni]|uniref:CLIP1_ZNF domain-containing protein n=1 Tax=Echinostoma caproni TaxID=27848 RepID=A0A183A9B9_9TREM|nr:unnamed protein product [Echinostoma caproni]